MTLEIIPGAEPWAVDGGPVGVLCLHGFTGNPSSMRPVAEAFAKAGYSIELPRLPGHGTTIDDMLTTGFLDWAAEAEAALGRLQARTEQVFVAGLSMGGLLTLWLGVRHPEIAGLVAINPVTKPLDAEIIEMARGMLDEGTTLIPGIGSDIADPDASETAYPGTPLGPLLSMIDDGVAPLSTRYGELTMPLLLMNSTDDHVVDPSNAEYLAEQCGSPVERVTLARSYHVATLDYDAELIQDHALAFVARVAQGVTFAAAAGFASIPSPGSNAIHLGPVQLRADGLMIALGVIAAVWLCGRRLEKMGAGTPDDISAVAVWAVAAGVLGSRAYHVITSWNHRFVNPLNWFKIWEGGLGIPGGIAAGMLVGVWRVRKRGVNVAAAVTAAAPALPLAQAIGRWGNWWNQELFGRPTTLPWALRVDASKAIEAGYAAGTTFHPTFLYESLGNFCIVGIVLLVERKVRLRPGALMAVYLALYALLRFGVESLRIDPANKILGLRVNTWVSGVVFFGAVGYLALRGRRPQPAPLESDPVS